MEHIFISTEPYRSKFYQKESSFKRFLELSEKQLSAIYKMTETTPDTLLQQSESISNLLRYQKTLQYLTNPLIHIDLRTYDERIAYLIIMVDPNLITFKEFLKINLISKAEIAKVEDENERDYLTELRKQTISSYKTAVIEKIGFFDEKLLKYEELFFKKFFSEKELITEVGGNNHDNLMIKSKSLKDFSSISDERYKELVSTAQTWLSLVPEKYNIKVAAYSVTHQHKLLGLTSLAEQLALFILLIDSNLDMLRIFEEESMMKIIEERIIEQFGYYNKELLILERKFHNRFCPDKELSIWSKSKKD